MIVSVFPPPSRIPDAQAPTQYIYAWLLFNPGDGKSFGKKGEMDVFIYLFVAWLRVLTDGSILQDGRRRHVSNTGGLLPGR